MSKSFFSLFVGAILTFTTLSAQRPEADTFKTNSGEITVQPILHGTLALYYQDKVIYVDPYGGEKAFEGIPDPDLLIRTSGEYRISNFLLWQISYTELCIVPTLWPDFSRNDLINAVVDYSRRERRFGGVLKE